MHFIEIQGLVKNDFKDTIHLNDNGKRKWAKQIDKCLGELFPQINKDFQTLHSPGHI
jgi:hypothetical protein